jgi:hypothetical protein
VKLVGRKAEEAKEEEEAQIESQGMTEPIESLMQTIAGGGRFWECCCCSYLYVLGGCVGSSNEPKKTMKQELVYYFQKL